ncbi:hypothetical protein ACQZ46_19735 [Agrobacterium salinitolerans]|uniref:Uncharacterized protein n=1 Tax=Agrobacterium salinitolerans TaxID=1183413 RepID=A0A9X3KLV8_9HYPH|nr:MULTISPECIES: hypothetical protein [Agrobacterium]MBA4776939.1 hypothetical protein [Hyphomicrobiales bacterium]MDA5641016.1 hypothetical protein [Agrobacterium sp. ST15.13.013]MCZ7851935.1 hypothetical protein [Agrobacterium salinitolerans]MCZ7857639.1 hypothetical protein [Agrobacterium salinitolerans]MCZ7888263.1 hypothetical protein [Agrobacterium salinitolerans]
MAKIAIPEAAMKNERMPCMIQPFFPDECGPSSSGLQEDSVDCQLADVTKA